LWRCSTKRVGDVDAGTYEQVLDYYSEKCRDAVMGAAMLVHCQRFPLDYVTGNMRLVTDLRRLASRLVDDNARAVGGVRPVFPEWTGHKHAEGV